jgi:hypothetical protein
MKLRFRNNSLRLRVNRREVEGLAAGSAIGERVHFPADACMSCVLEPSTQLDADASFENGTIRITAPQEIISNWAHSDSIGIYFEIPANGARLQVAIEIQMRFRAAAEKCADTARSRFQKEADKPSCVANGIPTVRAWADKVSARQRRSLQRSLAGVGRAPGKTAGWPKHFDRYSAFSIITIGSFMYDG